MKWVDGELVDNPNAEWAITDTTRADLRELIQQAFDEGLSPDELATNITELIEDPDRAERIADTELAMAQEQGAVDEWKESGVVQAKVWLLANDHDYSDDCDDNADAGEIPIDEEFPSGDDAPPAHVNCHCDAAAVIDEGEEE